MEGDLADLRRAAAVAEIVIGTVLEYRPIAEAWWAIPAARLSKDGAQAFLLSSVEYEALDFAVFEVFRRCRQVDASYHRQWDEAREASEQHARAA